MIEPLESRPTGPALIRKERLLPLPGEVLVEKGQVVQAETVVARTEELPGEPYVIDLRAELKAPHLVAHEVDQVVLKKVGDRVRAQEVIGRLSRGFWGEVVTCKSPVAGTVEFISRSFARVLIREDPRTAMPTAIVPVAKLLDVWPATLKNYMRFREGDEVRQGTVIAASPAVAGMDYAYSPISGVIEKICTRTGTVTIVRPVKETVVDAYVDGVVEEVIPERGAVIIAHGLFLPGVFGIGFEHHGPLAILTEGPEDDLDPASIGPEHQGRILAAGRRATLEGLRKAVEVGARGIVCGGADNLDLVSWLGKEIETGMTGQEDIDFTLILTEGFGPMPMAPATFAALKAGEGRKISVNGSTQIRAGVIRPEVIVFAGHGRLGEARASGSLTGGLAPGVTVRLVGPRYLGRLAQVLEVPAERRALETEARLRVVRVRLDDGAVIDVPAANVEILCSGTSIKLGTLA